jgi:pimeloyl-ACP methyl ester carboxylesterase
MKASAVHPIIYVRGYAMTQAEIEDTVADPYMGFNIGSCKVRQVWDGSVKKYFFESPLVRLLKQFNYDDVFEEGQDRVSELTAPSTIDGTLAPVPYRSIVIYRYYEPSSADIGSGARPDMTRFATGLSDLILTLRDRIYPDGAATLISDTERVAGKLPYDKFRVYLVAHSMGGLVCRAFLQNPDYGKREARTLVDKLFTYATPHNGIDVGFFGNVPQWLSLYGIKTFNRQEIAELLGLTGDLDGENVDIVTNFDANRVFNLVGTNPADYKVAAGLSSAFVGDASDGLVRIKNSTTRGRATDGFVYSPHAFVHRSHSGFFGIVNSEEGYQNLVRFLFGDVRADGTLEIDELTLPPAVQEQYKAGKDVRASYLFEVSVSVRGKTWHLHRRTSNENSAIFKRFDELFPKMGAHRDSREPNRRESPILFNLFLDMSQSQTGSTVSFALDLCVRVPAYEVDGVLFLKDHYEGGYLYRDTIVLEARPPQEQGDEWVFEYAFGSDRGAPRRAASIVENTEAVLTFEIPIEQPHPPGIRARLRVKTSYWNQWQ